MVRVSEFNYFHSSVPACTTARCRERQYRGGLCRQHYDLREASLKRVRSIYKQKSYAERMETYRVFVYVIRAENGLIKFGSSLDPEARLASLQIGSAIPMELLGYVPGSAHLEHLVHKLLKEDRQHGEWFLPSANVLSFAEAIASGDIENFAKVIV